MSDQLKNLELILGAASSEQLAAIDKMVSNRLWTPNPGPQTQALHSKADILLYGGAAGGGKSALLIGAAATGHRRAAIFRRESVELDGLEDYSREVLGEVGKFNGQDHEWSLPNDCSIRFGGMREPDHWRKYAGRARDYMAFDEAGEFLEEQVASIIAWLRSPIPGQRCRMILASNPPRGALGAWLIQWFAPWLDPLFPNPAAPGELRWAIMVAGKTRWVDGPGSYEIEGEVYLAMSRTFIPAKLADNPYNNTTEYRARLSSLPEPLRSQLLYGDFLAGKEDHERQVIPSAWIAAAQERWKKGKPAGAQMLALGVDVAQGGKDNTVLAPLYGTWFDELVRRKGIDTKNGPAVAALVTENMRNNCQVSIDLTGGWGISAKDHLEALRIRVIGVVFSEGTVERTRDTRFGFVNVRAQIYWQFREALDPINGDNIALPPDPQLAAQLGARLWIARGDKILIESKDDIRKRLGMSPDDADAVVMAWYKREQALYMQTKDLRRQLYTPDFDPYGDPRQSNSYDSYDPYGPDNSYDPYGF